jgi:hypothetical protein
VKIIGNVFSMGCSVHPSARPHRSSDAKPEWDSILLKNLESDFWKNIEMQHAEEEPYQKKCGKTP